MEKVSVAQLRGALDRDELVFFYQPKVSFGTGQIEGVEALVRWRKADGTLVPPFAFIPVAEESGLITELTLHLFPKLLEDYARMREAGVDLSVAFNASPKDFESDALVELVREAVEQGRIPAARLTVELTETSALSDAQAFAERLDRLVSLGVELAMDDYGTGYASLDTLRRFPFSILKIDQQIVRDMERSTKSAALVKSSISVAQMLGIKTVVEGIETEAMHNALLNSGCEEAQGYLYSKPVPLEELIELVRAEPSWRASRVGALRNAMIGHVTEVRNLMDWMTSAALASEGREGPPPACVLAGREESVFGRWYQGPGQTLRGERSFELMGKAHEILHETYAQIAAAVESHAGAEEISELIDKLGHYSATLFSHMQRLEAAALVEDIGERTPRALA